MKITREINGTLHEITLTDDELRAAYWEQQQLFDEADIQTIIDECDDDPEQFLLSHGSPIEQVKSNITRIALEKRHFENQGMGWSDAIETAIQYVLRRNEYVET